MFRLINLVFVLKYHHFPHRLFHYAFLTCAVFILVALTSCFDCNLVIIRSILDMKSVMGKEAWKVTAFNTKTRLIQDRSSRFVDRNILEVF